MKKKCGLFIIYLVITISCYSSNYNILHFIVEDMKLSMQLYKNYSALFPEDLDEIYNYIKIESIDTLDIAGYYRSAKSLCYLKSYNEDIEYDTPTLRLKIASYTLYSVKIVIDKRWYSNRIMHPDAFPQDGYDTLNYIILDDYGIYYKLFGFCVTDIREYHMENDQFKGFVDLLKKENLLTHREARYYYRSIVNEKSIIHCKVNRPCEYFKYRYLMRNEELPSSIILKRKLLTYPRAQIIKYTIKDFQN